MKKQDEIMALYGPTRTVLPMNIVEELKSRITGSGSSGNNGPYCGSAISFALARDGAQGAMWLCGLSASDETTILSDAIFQLSRFIYGDNGEQTRSVPERIQALQEIGVKLATPEPIRENCGMQIDYFPSAYAAEITKLKSRAKPINPLSVAAHLKPIYNGAFRDFLAAWPEFFTFELPAAWRGAGIILVESLLCEIAELISLFQLQASAEEVQAQLSTVKALQDQIKHFTTRRAS